ncbi:MAG: class II fructose-bisphosphate aldolase [Anaerolineales bacterium]
MPLVTSKEMLIAALEGHYAVGAFNANNMEQVQGIIEAAIQEKAPVILQVSQGAIKYAGLEFATAMVRTAAEMADVPVVLHLDHGTDFDQNVRCLRAGFTSLMYDGHAKPYEENVRTTARVCQIAHICNIPVEAELGSVLTGKVSPEEVRAAMTQPDQIVDFVERTGVDSLAVAIGSVHAGEKQEAILDIEHLKKLRAATDIPFVLHGSSGVKEDSEVEAIQYGVTKINVATMLNQAFIAGIKQAYTTMPDNIDPRKWLAISREMVTEVVRHKIRLFGSSGKASSSGYASAPVSFRSVDLGSVE